MRPRSPPCVATCALQPQMMSSTSAVSMPVRVASARSTVAARCCGWMPESAPLPALPTPRGVRQASMMSASVIGVILFLNSWRRFESRCEGSQCASAEPPHPTLSAQAKLVAPPQERGEGEQSRPRRVLRDHVAIEAGTELWRTPLRVEIDVVEPKALVEPEHPFKIVHQA